MGDLDERSKTGPEDKEEAFNVKENKQSAGGIGKKRIIQIISACLIGTMLAGAAIYYYNYRNTGYAVKYDGKFLGYVRDKTVAVGAFENARDEIKRHDPSIEVINNLEFEKLLVSEDKIVDSDYIGNTIKTDLYILNTSFAVSINGEEIANVGSEDEANEIVEGIRRHYKEEEERNGAEVLSVNIKDNIKVTKKIVDKSKLVDAKTVIDKIVEGKGVTVGYEVKSGDSVWEIAKENNMAIDEIAEINPGLDAEKIRVGQTIYLAVSEPYVNVETTVKKEFDESIPYDTAYKKDENLYRGQSRIVEKGQYGINKVVKEIIKMNGKEIASTILSTAVVKNPVTQVLAQGTRQLVGSGMFLWPTNGRITSPFGSRGREYHKGLDIGAAKGTPIHAADSGTVTLAQRYYGYGNLIIIDHGNGYETYYGHCSSIAVKKGQTVKRGEYIGAVGNTGNSYGNHLHFEIRLNGNVKNPINYLK